MAKRLTVFVAVFAALLSVTLSVQADPTPLDYYWVGGYQRPNPSGDASYYLYFTTKNWNVGSQGGTQATVDLNSSGYAITAYILNDAINDSQTSNPIKFDYNNLGPAVVTLNIGQDNNTKTATVNRPGDLRIENDKQLNILKGGTFTHTSGNFYAHGGTLTVNGGTLNVNKIDIINGSVLNLSSGTINIGSGGFTNAGTQAYPASTYDYTINLAGGTLATNGSDWSSALNANVLANTETTFDTAEGKTITWSGVLSGSGSIVKSGAGTLTLSGANTYSGGTTISNGTLKLTDSGSLGSGSVVNNGILEFAHTSPQTFSGVLSGSGSIVKSGAGTLTLSGANSYSGGTTISNGTLKLTDSGALGSGSVVNNGILEFAHTSPQTFSGVISGNGTLQKTGSGMLTLMASGSDTIGCNVIIDNGIVSLGNTVNGDNRFKSGVTVTVNSGGTLRCDAHDCTGYSGGAATFNLYGGTFAINIAGNETLANKTINLKGGSITTLNSNGSMLDIFGSGNAFNVKAETGATSQNPTTSYVKGWLRLRNTSDFNITVDQNAKLIIGNEYGGITQNGTPSPLVKLGKGCLVFAGTNTYSATTKVMDGELVLPSGGTLTTSGVVTVNGGNLTVDGGTLYTSSSSNSVNSGTITVKNNGSLTYAGAGQFRITGSSAALNIEGGTVTVNGISYIGVAANGVINQSGGTANFNNTLAFGWGDSTAGEYNLTGDGILYTTKDAGLWCGSTSTKTTPSIFTVNGGTANFQQVGNSFVIGYYNTPAIFQPCNVANVFNLNSGTVNATDTFAIQYGGTLNVAKDGETGGDGVLNANKIEINNGGNLNMSSGTINLGAGGITSSGNGYSINLSGGTFGTNNASWTTSLAATISSNAVTFAPDSEKTITWSGELSGAGGLTLDGEGELTLANPAYTGATTITQGTLNLSAAGTLHNLSGTTSGVLNNNGNTVTVESGADTEFAGVVVGTGGLTKTGTKTLTLSGANTYTGMTTVSAGVLELTGDAVVANGPVSVGANGTLEYEVGKDGNNQPITKKLSISEINKIVSTGTVKKTGDGTLQLYSAAQGLIDVESLTVSSGRVDLKGYMTGGITVDAGGVFSPGNSVGEATFGGGYILKEGATLLIEQDGSGIDKLNVGSFTFDETSVSKGIELDITGIPFGSQYDIITSSTDFTGDMLSDEYWLKHFKNDLPDYMTLVVVNNNTVRLSIDRNQVPEPSTWALLILGAAGLLYWRKRKNA